MQRWSAMAVLLAFFALAGVDRLASAAAAAPGEGGTFASAQLAVTALGDAVRAGNLADMEKVLGPGSEKLVSSGDKYADAAERQRFLAAYDARHQLVPAGSGRLVLQVGDDGWPLPIPLEETAGRWHFDSPAGAQELIDRRIGGNEIAAIRTALAYVDAQKEFFALYGEYAQHLVSRPGTHDGLYWPAAAGEPESPLAPLLVQAQEEGYPGERVAGKPVPYHGYFFGILTAQGANAPEGVLDYIEGGHMKNGFALVAWPAQFGASGIMTFIVNEDSVVFQKDLGADTAARAKAIQLFDPDLSWTRVDLAD
jgi:Protein of unknown function (DUF2950)